MFCSVCGTDIPQGAQFCAKCGQPVTYAAPAAYAAQPGVGAVHAAAGRRYAGFWLRFVAYVIDMLILIIPVWLVVVVVALAMGGFGALVSLTQHQTDNPAEVFALLAPLLGMIFVVIIFVVCLQWLYFAYQESSEQQATIGKRVMSLKVTDKNGNRLSFGHASGRFFSKIVTNLVPLAIGWILAGFTEKKQALHDFIAGTLVWRDN
ncbi:MAG TPA: RDD family protein [Candidatus Acidoferrales bacterium]|nr:RDD family protein [Candidatus Acidoferrales bacterium]